MPIGASKVGALGGLVPGGSVTFNTTDTWVVPPGVKKVSVTGVGGVGAPGNPGNAGQAGNAGNPGTGGGGGTGGSGNQPGCFGPGLLGTPGGWGGPPAYNSLSGGQTGQAGTGANAGACGTAGQCGQVSTALGQTFPGGAGGAGGSAGNSGNNGLGGQGGNIGGDGTGYASNGPPNPIPLITLPGGGGGTSGGGTGGRATVGPFSNPQILKGGGGGGAGETNDGQVGSNLPIPLGNNCPVIPTATPYRAASGGSPGGGVGGWGTVTRYATCACKPKFFELNTPTLPGANVPINEDATTRPSNSANNMPFANRNYPWGPAPYWAPFPGSPQPTAADAAKRSVTRGRNSTATRAGGGGGSGAGAAPRCVVGAGGGGGGRGNVGNPGQAGTGGTAGTCGVAGNPTTFNCVPVSPGSSAPIVVGAPGGQVVITWNPQ